MKFIPNAVTRKIARQILVTQKASPRVLFVMGIVGVATSTVMACRATLKLEEVLDDVDAEILAVQTDLKGKTNYNKDLAYVYVKSTYRVVKLYAPALIIGGASIGALTGSHITLTRRNASLTAAYAAMSKGFEEYRDRVRHELGDEKELDIYHAAVTEKVVDSDGKTKTIKVADPNKWSPYARLFDETSVNWVKNSEINKVFVQAQQNYANHLLQARGHVFLNEVYDMLGLERSQAGQVVGWVMVGDGDHYIDFGLYEAANARFVNNMERSIVLDFNVDGVIYDKI